MAEEEHPPDNAGPPPEANEQTMVSGETPEPVPATETKSKPHTSSEKVPETLELASKKKSMEPRKDSMSIERRRSSMRARTESLNSRAKLALGSIISIKKSDTVGDLVGEKGKAARFLNTYKLDSDKPFNSEKVQKIMEEILLEALEGPYDEAKCPLKAKQASGAIRAKVKELEFDRYKLVCIVTIGEKHHQDLMIACRFLWDMERDRFAMFSHETSHVFGVALCFGVYYE
ncbi:hypothetical protein HHI36_002673 [Cryptolaemus montrouzieri]|uniref:Uncharacterized protein n=1 Tax=Cryptolaemus montrouzieri TaxID=559131 RepID=A0ABD2PBB5_9CUCU